MMEPDDSNPEPDDSIHAPELPEPDVVALPPRKEDPTT